MSDDDKNIDEIAKALNIDKKYVQQCSMVMIPKESYAGYYVGINDDNVDKLHIKGYEVTRDNTIKMNIDCKILDKYNLEFHNCIFDTVLNKSNSYENNKTLNHIGFQSCEFKQKVCFDNWKTLKTLRIDGCIFEDEFLCRGSKFTSLVISNNTSTKIKTTFKNTIDITGSLFEEELTFLNVNAKILNFGMNPEQTIYSINARVRFSNCEFQDCKKPFGGNIIFNDVVDFKNNTFYNGNFSNLTFEKNVYFNNSKFIQKADFHECDFQQTACFYGVTFNESPNFSQARFEKGVNLTNVNLIFEIDKIKSVIEKQAQKEVKEIEKSRGDNGQIDDKEREELLNNTLMKVSNDFRDSYRNFKSGLIKDNNNLDASNFHRVELYCKEIELDFKKPTIFTRDWIDKWQLYFYRVTSDHHTDLLKIFNSTIMLIGIFVYLMLLTKIIDFLLPNTITLLKNIKGYNIIFYLSSFVAFMCICFLMFIMYRSKNSVCRLLNNNICLYLAYFGVILLLFINPQYIFGVANLFSPSSCTSPTQNVIMSIYSILAILFIFSLQKTARKNSIVPN